jgi:hypothetical protein
MIYGFVQECGIPESHVFLPLSNPSPHYPHTFEDLQRCWSGRLHRGVEPVQQAVDKQYAICGPQKGNVLIRSIKI